MSASTEVKIEKLATEVAESMREHRERKPKIALLRVLNSHHIQPVEAEEGGYKEGSIAKRVLQELQKRSVERAGRNRRLGSSTKPKPLVFPTSLFG